MAHPIIKWNPNQEYPCTMLGGPYGPDGEGPTPSKFNPGEVQWRYLIKVGDAPHYWYATDRANDMLEELKFNTKGAPFTVLKRVEGTNNLGFEIAGKTYDDIFGDPRVLPGTATTLPEHQEIDRQNAQPNLEDRMGVFAESVNNRFRFMNDEIKRLDGEIAGVRRAIDALGEPFPEGP